jgi:hypothetical protein
MYINNKMFRNKINNCADISSRVLTILEWLWSWAIHFYGYLQTYFFHTGILEFFFFLIFQNWNNNFVKYVGQEAACIYCIYLFAIFLKIKRSSLINSRISQFIHIWEENCWYIVISILPISIGYYDIFLYIVMAHTYRIGCNNIYFHVTMEIWHHL